MSDPKRLPDEAQEPTPCFKLQGQFGNRPTTLWLEKATYLIRRIHEVVGSADCTTVYNSQVDIEIPATELEFNAPKAR